MLRLPSFAVARRPAIDRLVGDNRARLLSTPYLVIDFARRYLKSAPEAPAPRGRAK